MCGWSVCGWSQYQAILGWAPMPHQPLRQSKWPVQSQRRPHSPMRLPVEGCFARVPATADSSLRRSQVRLPQRQRCGSKFSMDAVAYGVSVTEPRCPATSHQGRAPGGTPSSIAVVLSSRCQSSCSCIYWLIILASRRLARSNWDAEEFSLMPSAWAICL